MTRNMIMVLLMIRMFMMILTNDHHDYYDDVKTIKMVISNFYVNGNKNHTDYNDNDHVDYKY